MNRRPLSTAPRPFAFVLMPFKEDFQDVYDVAIKHAAEDAGAYAERVDEQHFTGSMLERIFNQIAKADVVIADVTGRNPNVYYEVGYAHALNKEVWLITQDVSDIPFDLRHRPHIAYERSRLARLRSDLVPKITSSLSNRRGSATTFLPLPFELRINGVAVPESGAVSLPEVELPRAHRGDHEIAIAIRNATDPSPVAIDHIYWLVPRDAQVGVVPIPNYVDESPVWIHEDEPEYQAISKRFALTIRPFEVPYGAVVSKAVQVYMAPRQSSPIHARIEVLTKGNRYSFELVMKWK